MTLLRESHFVTPEEPLLVNSFHNEYYLDHEDHGHLGIEWFMDEERYHKDLQEHNRLYKPPVIEWNRFDEKEPEENSNIYCKINSTNVPNIATRPLIDYFIEEKKVCEWIDKETYDKAWKVYNENKLRYEGFMAEEVTFLNGATSIFDKKG